MSDANEFEEEMEGDADNAAVEGSDVEVTEEEAALARKERAKAAASRGRDRLVSQLVKLGMNEADIGAAWSEARLSTEIATLKRVQARKKARADRKAVQEAVVKAGGKERPEFSKERLEAELDNLK